MSSNTNPEKRSIPDTDEHILEEMERIDEAFLDGLTDSRLDSGVPEEDEPSDEEFLDMSGITYSRPRDAMSGSEHREPEASPIGDEEQAETDPAGQPLSETPLERGTHDESLGANPVGEIQTEGVLTREDEVPEAEVPDDDYEPTQEYLETEQATVDIAPHDDEGSLLENAGFVRRDRTTLGEAQALLQELEAQPREGAGEDAIIEENTRDNDYALTAGGALPDVRAAAERSYRDVRRQRDGEDTRARPSRKSYDRPRQARRLRYVMVGALVAVVAGALAAGGYHAFLAVREHLNSSEVLLAEARDLVAREDYAAAMQRYERVAETIPRGVPERGEALFGAASSAFAWGMQGDGGNSALEVALRRVEEFQQEFPGHPKTARAEALQGILYLELGQPRRALEILGRSELRLRDQGAALPILRTLARAHAKLGEYDMARRAYLQAAGLEDNYTPDEDYGAVGLICEKLAEYNENPEAKREHLEMALEYWKHAAQVPGIDPVRADELKRRIALLESQLLALVPGNAARQRAPLEEGKDVLPGSGIDTSGHASYRAGPGGN